MGRVRGERTPVSRCPRPRPCRRRERLRLAAERRAREARARLAAQERLLALTSHDLREPLNALLGHLRLLAEAELPPGQRRHVETALEAASLLAGLVGDLLDLSRLEAGAGLPERRSFALDAFVRRVAALFTERARRRGLSFEVAVDPLLPPLVLGDPARLRRVLVNLLSNAFKYTETGGVRLAVEAAGGGRVRFSVEDTGRGLPPALAAATRPFARGPGEGVPGFGLGLFIARRLTRRLGGRLSLEPREGGGTRAVLEVPLPEAPAEEAEDRAGTPRILALAPPSGIVADLRGMAGVVVAPDAAAAIERLRDAADAGEPCEVVAVFAASPEEAAASARALREAACGAALLLHVPAGLPGDVERARVLGFDAYLAGPFDAALFLRTARRLAAGRPSRVVVRHDVEERPARPLTVLVVEDDPLGARLLAILLERLGHRVLHAADAADALAVLAAQPVDAVLLDLQLPDVHGLELARRLRAHPDPRIARVPVVVVSGSDAPAERQRARAVGVVAFLAKPVERSGLAAALAQCANPF
ncbi:Signal transduction histidine-protein kinase BarA [bacterium HR39]|nr:Signal transduction histidine-protein kinase BarA [bacterium HR39]